MSESHLTLVARDIHKSFGSGEHFTPVLRGVGMDAGRACLPITRSAYGMAISLCRSQRRIPD